GSLGDRYGRKGALAGGLAVFAAGSVAAALAHSPGMLIVARGLMGVGGAFIMPTTLSIVSNVFVEPGERAKAIAIWTGVAGLGVAIGPLAGGFLLSHFSWSSVFAVNIPLSLAALFFVSRLVPTSRNHATGPLDLPGVALSIAALSSLVYGIIEAPARGWTSPVILGTWTLAAVAGIGFVARELHTGHP